MGMYTGLRFKGIVKEEFRNDFEDIALCGDWSESNDEVLRRFGNVSRASFIPCGTLCYMPSKWEVGFINGVYYEIPTDGFERTYDKNTGRWTFQCSLKNYDYTIEEFMKIVPYFIEEVEHAEVFYEEWSHSEKLELVNGEMVVTNSHFIKYWPEEN